MLPLRRTPLVLLLAALAPGAHAAPGYHTYETLTADLQQVAAAHPAIVRLTSLGASVQGRQLWMVKISKNPDLEEDEPEVRYIAGMHGDEVVGIEMCVNLIHLLAEGYGADPRITALVDATEIWILPSMNPDGTAAGTRANANGVDLNRDFPDQFFDPIDSPAGREPETRHVMNWGYAHATNLSANFHGGVLVVRYPFDGEPTGLSEYSSAPDEAVLISLARTYADLNPSIASSNGDVSWDDGITNGSAWYLVPGGMQDWNYVWRGGRELTLEISATKSPGSGQLPGLWEDNRESMLALLERAHEGVRGVVRDAVTGAPLAASVRVSGLTDPGAVTFTDPDAGDYHRILLPGRYDLEVSAEGYAGTVVRDVRVTGGAAVRRDVALVPLAPRLVLEELRVIDGAGGDGALSPGETASLAVAVRNLGSEADGIVARLVPTGWSGAVQEEGVVLADVDAGARADAAAPLPSISAASDAPAGGKLGFALEWTSSSGAGVTEPLFVPVGAPDCSLLAATDVPLPIADRQTTASTVPVAVSREISSVGVEVAITHASPSDLHVRLVSPSGTPVLLHARTETGSNTLAGSYPSALAPFEPLARLDGEPSSGAWTLSIRDGQRSNAGTLDGWSLRVCGRPFEAAAPELRIRDVARRPGGGATITWWPYPGAAPYRVFRAIGSAAPEAFSNVTAEDDDAGDERFDDSSADPLVFWRVE